MRRRDLLVGAPPRPAGWGLRAQAPRMRRVALAMPGVPEVDARVVDPIKNRLGVLGWVEGGTIEYAIGYAHGQTVRYESMIAELLAKKPDVLLVWFGLMAMIAKKQTRDVPIVFAISSNPDKNGLVDSLAKPGGNVTGVSTRELELLGKRIEILKEITPGMVRVAVLVNPDSPEISKLYVDKYGEHSRMAGMQLLTADARSAKELRAAFDSLARRGAQGLLNIADPIQGLMRNEIAAEAARTRIPAVYTAQGFVEAGGLASFGIDPVDQARRAAAYVDKILRGAKPADLPVEEPTNFPLAVNLKAAREQGIKLPQSILARADRVIE